MWDNKFNTGDYVKWIVFSKRGKEFYEKGMVTSFDIKFAEKNLFGKVSNDYILYYIITDEQEEITKYQKNLEIDIQSERESKLNNLFDE